MDGLDTFPRQAMDLLTSSRLAEALDLSKEDPRIVERYGTGNPKIMMDGNGAPRVPQSFLLARRLIEAGVRVVTMNYSKWDWHGGFNAEGRADNRIFVREQEDFPIFDNDYVDITAILKYDGGSSALNRIKDWVKEFGRGPPSYEPRYWRDHTQPIHDYFAAIRDQNWPPDIFEIERRIAHARGKSAA